MSGGQQQLVGFTRALIAQTKLILTDEPTGNLSSKQGEEIMHLFKQLNTEGVTIIRLTHFENNAEWFAGYSKANNRALLSEKNNYEKNRSKICIYELIRSTFATK